MMLGVRNDSKAQFVNVDGDYTPIGVDDQGGMHVHVIASDASSGYADAAAANVDEPAANTAAVITYAAGGAGFRHLVGSIMWSYDAVPTGGGLTITDGGATRFAISITNGGPGFVPEVPIRFGDNTIVVITLAAGGAGISGKLNVLGHWVIS